MLFIKNHYWSMCKLILRIACLKNIVNDYKMIAILNSHDLADKFINEFRAKQSELKK